MSRARIAAAGLGLALAIAAPPLAHADPAYTFGQPDPNDPHYNYTPEARQYLTALNHLNIYWTPGDYTIGTGKTMCAEMTQNHKTPDAVARLISGAPQQLTDQQRRGWVHAASVAWCPGAA